MSPEALQTVDIRTVKPEEVVDIRQINIAEGLSKFPNGTDFLGDAYEYLIERRSVNLFEKHKVMSEVELLSRREIYLDIYNKIINVEARTMLMMVKHEIIPAIIDYKDKLANAIIKLNKIDSTYSNVEQNLLKMEVKNEKKYTTTNFICTDSIGTCYIWKYGKI